MSKYKVGDIIKLKEDFVWGNDHIKLVWNCEGIATIPLVIEEVLEDKQYLVRKIFLQDKNIEIGKIHRNCISYPSYLVLETMIEGLWKSTQEEQEKEKQKNEQIAKNCAFIYAKITDAEIINPYADPVDVLNKHDQIYLRKIIVQRQIESMLKKSTSLEELQSKLINYFDLKNIELPQNKIAQDIEELEKMKDKINTILEYFNKTQENK